MKAFPMRDMLTRPKVLWLLFGATLAMTIAFGLVMKIWQFELIDEMYLPDQIKAHLASLTPSQKYVHAWVTATLDVAYPLAYGGFFIGMALRFFGRYGAWLALPGVLVIPVDLAEGLVQILLLNGVESVLGYKQILTPLKLGLFFPGLAIAVLGGLIAARHKWRR